MPLKVLVISAGYDFRLNEMSHVWQALSRHHGVTVLVVAPAKDTLKAQQASESRGLEGGVTVHWVDQQFPLRFDAQIASLVDEFKPDLVFVGPREHLDCGKAVAQRAGAPLILHTEYFYTDHRWLRRRDYAGIPMLRSWRAAQVRAETLNAAAVVCVSDPMERAALPHDGGAVYLPWPHLVSASDPVIPQGDRDSSRLIYVGSLFKAKGADRLGDYFAAALKAFPDMTALLVGPVIDASGQRALAKIKQAGGERVQWRESMPREQAEALIAKAFCVLSPGEGMGWGQIGDAWRVGTPVIAYCQHYELRPGENCLLAATATDYVNALSQLRHDEALRATLAAHGHRDVLTHSVPAVAQVLAAHLDLAISRARPGRHAS